MLLATVTIAMMPPPRGAWPGTFAWAASAGVVLLFSLHGAKLSHEAIVARARNGGLHLATLAVTFILFRSWAGCCGKAGGSLGTAILFLTPLPSTVQSSVTLTAVARGNVAAALCAASSSNLIGILPAPVLAALLVSHSGGLSLHAAGGIFGKLLLPFVAGQALRAMARGFLQHHGALTRVVDRGSILLVVYSAFGAAVVEGLWRIISGGELAQVAALCVALLAAVLLATGWIGRLLGFEWPERIVLQFCGSKKAYQRGCRWQACGFPQGRSVSASCR